MRRLVPRPRALARKLFQWFREFAWIVAFLVIALPAISKNLHAQPRRLPPTLDITVAPADSATLVLLEYGQSPDYEAWWQQIAACENLPLPPHHILVQFFAVNTRQFGVRGGSGYRYIGYSHLEFGQLYIAFPYINDQTTVKHEMLHFLMYWAGEGVGHPAARFGTVESPSPCGVVPYRRPVLDER